MLSSLLSPFGAGEAPATQHWLLTQTQSPPVGQEQVQVQEVTLGDSSAKHLTDHTCVINFSVNRFVTGFRISSFKVLQTKFLNNPKGMIIFNLCTVVYRALGSVPHSRRVSVLLLQLWADSALTHSRLNPLCAVVVW